MVIRWPRRVEKRRTINLLVMCLLVFFVFLLLLFFYCSIVSIVCLFLFTKPRTIATQLFVSVQICLSSLRGCTLCVCLFVCVVLCAHCLALALLRSEYAGR